MLLSLHLQNSPLLIAVVLAFIGGLLSFASPCCVPLIPGYLGHLASTAVAPGTAPTRRGLFAHGATFVFGFSTVFTVAGIAVGQVLTNVQALQGWVRWIGGAVIILMGLHTTGLIEIPALHRTFTMHPTLPALNGDVSHVGLIASATPMPIVRDDGRIALTARRTADGWLALGRSYFVGIFFAAGWSPCVGPILTGIYGIAGTQPTNAGILFFTYSLGLGVPFLVVAFFFGHIRHGLWRLNRYYNMVSLISGLFLIFIGILLFTDTFSRLARYAPAINLPGFS
ncbi:MAG: cytochrome c biogenesis CcdA family protein [Thermomicrobiales bacterium]